MRLSPVHLPTLPPGVRFDVPRVRGTFEVRALTGAAEIELFDSIGMGGVTAARIAAALRQVRGRPVTVLINSHGGDYFEGAAIFNLIAGHDAPVTVRILGIAASAASLIAMAGDRIEIARNAQIMVHRAQGLAGGDADLLRHVAGILDSVDRALAAVYAARSSQSEAAVASLMRSESFLAADEAIELGFADAILDNDALPAPETVGALAPKDIRSFEAELRRIGFSKRTAVAVAAHGWPGLAAGEFDWSALAEAFGQNLQQVQKVRF